MRIHRILRIAKIIKAVNRQLDEFYKEYQDDSDSENNAHANGYFPARPSYEECVWEERRRFFVADLNARLVDEILKDKS